MTLSDYIRDQEKKLGAKAQEAGSKADAAWEDTKAEGRKITNDMKREGEELI